MTSRQARTERRTAERKAKKAEMRRNKQADLELHERPLEEEFSADLIAEANAMRDRVHRRALDPSSDRKGAPATPASPSQPPAPAAPQPIGFVSQNSHRAEINRQNAQHSTGPVTIPGKLASSRNSLKHGLASGQIIIPGEDACAFESLLAALLDEHQPAAARLDEAAHLSEPKTLIELLVNEMAQSHWLVQRALRLQNECFSDEGVDDKRLSLYMRYHTTHQRAFHKALIALMKMKKERARGFVSHSAKRAAGKSGFVPQNVGESLKPSPESPALPPETEFVRQNDRSEAA